MQNSRRSGDGTTRNGGSGPSRERIGNPGFHHVSHPPFYRPYSEQLRDVSLSNWTANPVSLPPRIGSGPSSQHSHLAPRHSNFPPSEVPTVPPRNNPSSNNGISDNWVDLEELYRWLQELEDTKTEVSPDRRSGVNYSEEEEEDNMGNKNGWFVSF